MLDRRDLAVVLEQSTATHSVGTRRDILDALVRTIALRGYDRTTIDRVLLAADVPAAVFEEHFEDKHDCLLAALDELIAGVQSAICERVPASASWSERVRAGLQALLAVLAGHPDGARVAFVECLSAGEAAIARVHRAIASTIPILEEGRLLEEGRDGPGAGVEAADIGHLPPQTSEAVVGGIASILHRRILDGDTSQLPALLPDLLYFALMPYLGHERALAAYESAAAGA
jgi:AcrR family transcriptional regulator